MSKTDDTKPTPTVQIELHREARKERENLPSTVAEQFKLVEAAIALDPYAPIFTKKREAHWKKRTMLVAEARLNRTTYRMAWEIVSREFVIIWAYGPHENFYKKLGRRADQ